MHTLEPNAPAADSQAADTLSDEALIRRRLEHLAEAIEVLMPKVREGDMDALRLLLRTSEMELRLLRFRAQSRTAAERATLPAAPKTGPDKTGPDRESPRTEGAKVARQEPPRERAAQPDKASTHPAGPAVAPEKPTTADPRGPNAAADPRGHAPAAADPRTGPKAVPGTAH